MIVGDEYSDHYYRKVSNVDGVIVSCETIFVDSADIATPACRTPGLGAISATQAAASLALVRHANNNLKRHKTANQTTFTATFAKCLFGGLAGLVRG